MPLACFVHTFNQVHEVIPRNPENTVRRAATESDVGDGSVTEELELHRRDAKPIAFALPFRVWLRRKAKPSHMAVRRRVTCVTFLNGLAP